jgi:SP family sugar:H+ symporter-like MFS transporter
MDVPTGPITVENHMNGQDPEKGQRGGKLSVGVTLRTVVMAILVAMGGFIFGYDTGQISGFLEMEVFLQRFGEPGPITQEHPYGYYFTNVRSGLIVGLVSSNLHPHLSYC